MGNTVAIPLWVALPLGLLAAWAAYDKLLMPAINWFVAGQANRVIDELGERLRIGVRPFQRTRRQILIHRLLGDPRVLHARQAKIEAAVLDYQNDELVAFVAAPSMREPESAAISPAPPIDEPGS